MQQYYVLTFGTATGDTVAIRVPNANPSPGVNAVAQAMSKILSTNALLPKYGQLTSKEKAELYTVTTTEFNV